MMNGGAAAARNSNNENVLRGEAADAAAVLGQASASSSLSSFGDDDGDSIGGGSISSSDYDSDTEDADYDDDDDEGDDPLHGAFQDALQEELEHLLEQGEQQQEVEEDGDGTAQQRPPAAEAVSTTTTDPSMDLSDEERDWALEVKRSVLQNENLLPLTDFEYVWYALVSEGNLQEALWRIERMQDFQQHYGLQHTVQEGMECILGLMEQQPGFILHIDVDPSNEASINVIDIGAFDASKTLTGDSKQEDNWRTYILGIHYMKWVAQPTFATIRAGFYALADCGNVQGGTTFKLEKLQIKMFHELLRYYPFKWQKFMAFNTGYFANIMMSVMKTVMPDKIKRCIQVGCQVGDVDETRSPTVDKLSDMYLQPNMEEAYRHVIFKVHSLLQQRVHNMKTFRL